MQLTGCLPAGLADMPPGPELGAALAGIELSAVPASERLTVLEAWHRQDSHTRAGFYRAMVAVGYADPTTPDSAEDLPDPHLDWTDEVRAALAWTRRAADGWSDEACALVRELPRVLAALHEGRIDPPKASVFVRHLAGLPPAQVAHLCALVLPRAPRWTTSQISRRLRRLIMEIDPDHYERLFRRAHARRGVGAYVTEDGTATITASGITPETADAAVERIDHLARRIRRCGHPGTLDQIRVDLFTGFLDGTLHTLSDDEIVHALLLDAGISTGDDGETGATVEADATATGPTQGSTNSAGTTERGPADEASEAGDPSADEPQQALHSRHPARPPNPRRGVHLQISLGTLLGLDDRPATLPNLGPLPASRARVVAATQLRAPWRYAVTGPDGRLIRAGALRTRPTAGDLGPAEDTTSPEAPGMVDLLVDAGLLARLTGPDSDLPASWRPVLAEILAARGRDLDDDPDARFPHTGLRRHVEFRDRHCTFVGCLTPARKADLDHTHDHAQGGRTTADDLGPACRHDHGLKHRGWTLTQPEPGVFVWRSPLGRTYRTRAEPLLPPLPPPLPRMPDEDLCCPSDTTDDLDEAGTDSLFVVWRPAPPEEPRPPPPPVTDLDEPPPF
ncbi:hypothetical protein GCM10010472_70340 [Pseudonocardia halophobica]|uniref:HNH nuclease domain-containing protein n=1 Tax=Pseudonocardia halophobica TaxID=29401 RepID=A0A9W6L758_9PSEU|nr:hypothetical protein GCM10017577_34500 [Pseudonocardia halophobica]